MKLVVLAWEKERRAEHMQITLRIARQQLSLRALLLIAGAALMIIVGLLGMHTFSADVAGHDAHHSATASTAPEHSTPMAATSDISGAIACDDTCLMGTGQSHSDMVTACTPSLAMRVTSAAAACMSHHGINISGMKRPGAALHQSWKCQSLYAWIAASDTPRSA